ncbi:MAG: hypothetical protein ACRC6I_04420, partial [Paracoccaceae bacterium]
MAALAVRTMVLWPISVRMAQRMLELPLWRYIQSLQGPVIGTVTMVVWVMFLPVIRPDLQAGVLLFWQIGTGAAVYAVILALASFGRLREIARLVRNPKDKAQ